MIVRREARRRERLPRRLHHQPPRPADRHVRVGPVAVVAVQDRTLHVHACAPCARAAPSPPPPVERLAAATP